MGKDKLSNKEKKEMAYDLFMNTDKSQNEICEFLKIAPKTLSGWKIDGMWEELKGAQTITAKNIEINVLKKLHDMSLGDTLNADAMAKLARVIEVISEKKYTISQMFNVFKAFTNWLYPKDPDAAKMLNRYQREFIDDQIVK
jgi:hypothetical protein